MPPMLGYILMAQHKTTVTLFRRAANLQRSALFKEFNAPPPPPPPPTTHLVCNDHLIANFLSFHISLVVVMNCGAGNALYVALK